MARTSVPNASRSEAPTLSPFASVRAAQLVGPRISEARAREHERAQQRRATYGAYTLRTAERARLARERLDAFAEPSFEEPVGALIGAGLASELAARITDKPESGLCWLALGCHLGAALGRSFRPR